MRARTDPSLTQAKKKKKAGDPIADNMETFFNPFEERRKEEGKVKEELVCEAESFRVDVELENLLIVPVEVVNASLIWAEGVEGEEQAGVVEKSSVRNFVVPPKNKEGERRTVRFEVIGGNGGDSLVCVGVRFVCLART